MKYTKIKDLVGGQKNVFIKNCKVINTQEIQESVIDGKSIKRCDGKISDESGEINITAWDYSIPFLKDSKEIDIENCYVKEYNKILQLTTGKFGRIKKIK